VIAPKIFRPFKNLGHLPHAVIVSSEKMKFRQRRGVPWSTGTGASFIFYFSTNLEK
jgi:hypothetical protein